MNEQLERCVICGAYNIERIENQTKTIKFKTASRIKTIILTGINFSVCKSCGEIYYNAKDSKLYDKKLMESLEEMRKDKGLLTAQEIKEIREELGYTQDQLDKLLGFGAKSFARWETYKADQSKAADLLLRALKSGGNKFLNSLLSEQEPVKTKKHKAA